MCKLLFLMNYFLQIVYAPVLTEFDTPFQYHTRLTDTCYHRNVSWKVDNDFYFLIHISKFSRIYFLFSIWIRTRLDFTFVSKILLLFNNNWKFSPIKYYINIVRMYLYFTLPTVRAAQMYSIKLSPINNKYYTSKCK